MKACVLDTHVLLWHLARPAKLGRRARALLREVDAGRRRGWIPAISAIELTILRDLGRTEVGPAEIDAMLADNPHFEILPLDFDQVHEFAALQTVRDPFDRMIAAAALASRCPLLSADASLAAGGAVQVIWD